MDLGWGSMKEGSLNLCSQKFHAFGQCLDEPFLSIGYFTSLSCPVSCLTSHQPPGPLCILPDINHPVTAAASFSGAAPNCACLPAGFVRVCIQRAGRKFLLVFAEGVFPDSMTSLSCKESLFCNPCHQQWLFLLF